jgi:hypothetical protein
MPAMGPAREARCQKSAATYAGRNVAAHLPKKSAVVRK